MILDGELTIHHKDRYSKELKKFVQDEFDGGWETSAEGKCVDFNLMMAGAVTGSIEHMILGKGQKSPIELGLFSFIYLYKGSLSLDDDNASEGDLVVIEDPKEIILLANERCEMVICSVNGQLKGPAF
jgi:environmental stress-induced protein Ves